MLVRAYHKTYGMSTIITRSSNNFGPYQYPEKLIPLFITNAMENKSLPLYGDGENVRDWIYVLDNCEAIDMVLQKGSSGETYNIGGGNEMQNVEITELILKLLSKPKSLIKKVPDRLGHDRRYSVNCDKVKNLGWSPRHDFYQALEKTISWYQENNEWWKEIKEKQESFKAYYQKQYKTL
jgi:dTDP-glucose 4,6-dehydratase